MKFRIFDEKERTAKDFVEYFRRIVPPGPKEFSTLEEFNQLRLNKHHSVVGFFESYDNSEWKSFIRDSLIMRYINFIYTTNTKLLQNFGISNSKNSIILFYTEQILSQDEKKVCN